MQTLWQDLRYGAGMLVRSPRSTLVSIIALALGIGATTAIFSFVGVLVMRPLPFDELDKIVHVWETRSRIGTDRHFVAPANFRDWEERQNDFQHLAAYALWDTVLTENGEPEQLRGFRVSPHYFPLLGMQPGQGRTFHPDEDSPGRDNVVVLAHGFWQRRLGGDAGIVGRTLTLDDRKTTVIGIMPPEFDFPLGTDLWAPLALDPEEWSERDAGNLRVLGRLGAGSSRNTAQASMTRIALQLEQEHASEGESGVRVVYLRDEINFGSRQFLLLLLGAAGFLLLLACFNVAHLQLVRAGGRQKEIAIRLSLGASRGRIVRQLLTESMLVSLVSAAAGVFIAVWAVDAMKASVPPRIARFIVAGIDEAGIDGRVLAFTLLIAVLSGVLSGLAPALETSKPRLSQTLAGGGRGSGMSFRRRRVSSMLVVSEIALSIVLLVGAGLMVKGFRHLTEVERGFNDRNLLTMRISLPEAHYEEESRVAAYFDNVLTRVGTLPQVRSVAAVSNLPAVGGSDTRDFRAEGHHAEDRTRAYRADVQVVSRGFFETLEIPVRGGRPFTETDTADAPRVGIISETMARHYWPGEIAVGRRIHLGTELSGEGEWIEIVGTVGDVSREWIDDATWPTIYLPQRQAALRTMDLVVRTKGDPFDASAAIRKRVWSVDAALPISGISSLRKTLEENASGIRLSAATMGVFGVLAFLLCAAGIYALVAQTVTHRTHEVGVRLALGAQRRQILGLFVRQGLRLTILGVGIGLPVALILMYMLSSALFGVVAIRPGTIATFTVSLVGVAILASYLPARRASQVDPVVALRYE